MASDQDDKLRAAVHNVALQFLEQAAKALSQGTTGGGDAVNSLIQIKKFTEAYESVISQGGTHQEATTAASAYYTDPDEAFDGWLPIGIGFRSQFLQTEGQLRIIRDVARVVCATNDIAQAIIFLYQAFTIGEGFTTVLLPTELDAIGDIEKYVDAKPDADQKQLMDNWLEFIEVNDFTNRLDEHLERKMRDGEAITNLELEIVDGYENPVVVAKFIDPTPVSGEQQRSNFSIMDGANSCGVITLPLNREKVLGVLYQLPDGKSITIKPENLIFDKYGTDKNVTRGISAFYSSFPRLRRIEKLLVNVSVLGQIQSAIALIRKHPETSGTQLGNFVARRANGGMRKDSATDMDVLVQKFPRGAIVDAKGFDYEFPAHSVNSENFLKIIDKELSQIAGRFLLPVKWLIGEELDKPLDPGSRTIKGFKKTQRQFYGHGEFTKGLLHEFWNKVQTLKGAKPEALKKWRPEFYGPHLPVAGALDEARIGEIEQRCGILSPQTWASQRGRNWFIERLGSLQHRATKQPDEVMPGDAGNTNVTGAEKTAGQGGDGTTKKKGGQRGGAKESIQKDITVKHDADGKVVSYQINEISDA